MYEIMFFDMLKYVSSESVFNTLYIEINHKSLKSSLLTKQKVQKMPSFYFCKHQLMAVLLLICDSYMN